ncbi:MAG: hypothetical protein AAFU79_27625 [Myxococcota bacterium]
MSKATLRQEGVEFDDFITPWSEIVAVSGYKLDCMTEILTYVTFEHECGEHFELENGAEGFDEVVSRLHTFLDIPSDWFAAIERCSPDDDPVDIWTRPST